MGSSGLHEQTKEQSQEMRLVSYRAYLQTLNTCMQNDRLDGMLKRMEV